MSTSSSTTSRTSSEQSRDTPLQIWLTPEAPPLVNLPLSDADADFSSEQRKVFAEHEPYRRPCPRKNDAEPWQACYQAVEKHDTVVCKDWKEDVDTLLVFAGLFSAVVTAFTIESYKWLEPDPADTSALLLLRISEQLANGANGTIASLSQDFSPTLADIRINVFWFLSLSIALVAALVGILCKQWLREFEKDAGLSYRHGLALRQMRYEALKKWKVEDILSMLPLLLQLALLCFFIGLLNLLWDRNTTVAIVVTAFIGAAYVMVLVTTVLPTFLVIFGEPYTHLCAYKSPQALVFLRSIDFLWKLHYIPTTTGKLKKRVDGTSALHWIDLERVHLNNSYVTNEYLAHAIGWVEDTFSQNPDMIPHLYHCVSELHSLSANHIPWVYRGDILGDVLYPPDRTLLSDGAFSKDRALFAYLAQHKLQLDPVMKKHFIELFLRRVVATKFEGAAVEWESLMGIDWRSTKKMVMMTNDVYWQLLAEGELTREVLCASVEPILSLCFGLLVDSKNEPRFAQMVIGFDEGTRFTHSVSVASNLIAMLHMALRRFLPDTDSESEADAHMIRGYLDACCSAMKIEERGDTHRLRLIDWPKCRLLDLSEFRSPPEASALRELQALVVGIDDLRRKFEIGLGEREQEWTVIVEKIEWYRKQRESLVSATHVVPAAA